MILTSYESQLIHAFYDYNRIPLWILNSEFQTVSYICASSQELNDALRAHIEALSCTFPSPAFDILCTPYELYFIFAFTRNKKTYYMVGGPMLLSECFHLMDFRGLSCAKTLSQAQLKSLAETLPIVSLTSFASCLRIMMLILTHATPTMEEISNYRYSSLSSSHLRHLFEQETGPYRAHTPYQDEIAVLNCVKEGNTAKLEATYKTLPATKYGTMSQNPMHQLFYGCIANTTLVTRYAIQGGLEEETAFTLSDLYIQQMEHCHTLYELSSLNEKMALDFTMRVAKSKQMKQPKYSRQVTLCMDYISTHLREKITLHQLAEQTHLSEKYLSSLFHKETGETLSRFIEKKRIDEAKNLLTLSNYSFTEISTLLAFSSQSYFIKAFKKWTHMTPKKYRDGIIKTAR